MPKKGGGQKVSTQVDPKSQEYIQQMRGMAQRGAGAAQSTNYFSGPNATFERGVGGLMDPAGFAQQFMNPFESQVIGGVQSDFDRQRQMAMMGGAQNATAQGAFGGSRSGVLQAQGLNDVNRNEAQTLAGLRMGGYNQSMNLGMQNAQGLMGAGEMQRQIQNQTQQNGLFGSNQALQMMNLGMGPYGTTQRNAPQGGGAMAGAAGGAMSGYSVGGPWGALFGGGLGLLGSL